MNNMQIELKVEEMDAINEQIKELEAKVEAIKDALKAELDAACKDEINTGKHIIRYKLVESNRFDTTKFKKEQTALYNAYLKNSVTTRFTCDAVA